MTVVRPILVVDDDRELSEALAEFLRDEGYSVLTAANGAEGLRLMRQGTLPGLVLLDLLMPVLDGVRFRLRQIADPSLAGVPVIVMSASGLMQEVTRRLELDAALEKPIDVTRLLTC